MTEQPVKYFVAGHRGMVGQAIASQLAGTDAEVLTRTRAELDLTEQAAVRDYISAEKPDVIVLAAAKVGGIHANSTYPAEFLYENLMIQNNVIHSAHLADVDRLLFLGSSCIYPKFADQPIVEAALLTGPLEPTNEAYAIAKIAGIKLCESYRRQYGRDYRSVMPSNLYGPNDNYHPENSHVIPGLIRRFHEAAAANAKEVTLWGTGTPTREFLHVDDMARASLFVLDLPRGDYDAVMAGGISHINVGSGDEISIRELATVIADVVGFKGKIVQDLSKPDGTPRKVMDSSLLASLGWRPDIGLKDGLAESYRWFLENAA
ncbi:MAG: GDP-L-fucose synthase [Silicimonas sp.]|nr:GDP-L-fucose synthase [Silicimonas sp.]